MTENDRKWQKTEENDSKWRKMITSHAMAHNFFLRPDQVVLDCARSLQVFFCISQKVDIRSGVTDDSLTNGQTLKDRATQLLRSRGWRALVTQMIGLGLIKVKHSKENSVFEIKCYLGRIKAAQWIWWWPWWRWWQATIFLWIQIQTFRLFNNKTVSSGVLCKEAAIKWGGCWVVINWHFWTLYTTRVGKNGENYEGIWVSSLE